MPVEPRFRVRELAPTGRLRTADEPTTIGPNDLAVCKNMRPSDQGPRGIGGMTKINTAALASTGIRNGFHFRKSQPAESHLMVWTNDGKLWKNDTAIPSQGAFSGTPVWADSAGANAVTGMAATPGGGVVYCNGVDTIFWGGTEYRCAGFVDIPDTNIAYDYSSVIKNTKSDSANVATIHTDGGTPPVATFYVGSIMPVDGFKLYISTANNKGSSMGVKYWDGTAWQAVTTLVDNTKAGGVSLAATGTVTFVSTASTAKISPINGIFLYWYQVTITSDADEFSGTPKIYYTTVSIPSQQIKDVPDGEMRPCDSFLLERSGGRMYDFTPNVATVNFDASNAGTYAAVNSLDTSADSWLLAGFSEPMCGFSIGMGDLYVESGACTMTVKYWDGAAWQSVSGFTDGTSNGTASLARSGLVTWAPLSENVEQKYVQPFVSHATDNVYRNLYFYQITFSTAITTDDRIDLFQGIPAPKSVRGYSFPIVYQNRVALLDNKDGSRNSMVLTAQYQDNVFNGLDSFEWFFGKNEPLVAAAPLFLRLSSSVQDMLVVCKQGETWIMEGSGSSSDPYRQRLLSEKIGCVAPLTMTTVPVGDLGGGVRRQLAIWESQRGIEVFDGASLMDPMLSHDIRDKFDPTHANYAGSENNAGFYDPIYDEYHWCSVGTAEWVFSFKYKKWYQPVRGTSKYLYGGIPVMDTSGNSYVYGFDNAGYVYRLEHGTDFDGNDIVHTLKTGAVALNENKISEEVTLRMVKVVQVAKNTTANLMTVTHFGDTDTTGNSIGTIDPAATGKRLRSAILNAGSKGPHVHHEFQLSMTTDDEVSGCEPIYIVAYYDGERQDVR